MRYPIDVEVLISFTELRGCGSTELRRLYSHLERPRDAKEGVGDLGQRPRSIGPERQRGEYDYRPGHSRCEQKERGNTDVPHTFSVEDLRVPMMVFEGRQRDGKGHEQRDGEEVCISEHALEGALFLLGRPFEALV